MKYQLTLNLLAEILMGKSTLGQSLNFIKYKFSHRRSILNYYPTIISIVTTDKCNFRCFMCQTHSPVIPDFSFRHNKCDDISFDLFKQVVDKFKKAKELSIIGTGEPLLNKDFFRMVEYGVKVGKMRVSSCSNGSFSSQQADQIISSGLSAFNISLNTHNAVDFHRLTGMGEKMFEKIVDNTQSLISKKKQENKKISIMGSFIIDQLNFNAAVEMIELGVSLELDKISLNNFLPTSTPGFTVKERCITTENDEAIKFLKDIDTSQWNVPINLPIIYDTSGNWKLCDNYFKWIRVDGEGNVGGCPILILNLEGGKYYEDDVWNNKHFISMRNRFLNKDSNDNRLEPCKFCVYSTGISLECL